MDESIDLKEVLRLHGRWIHGYEDGRRADLSQRDLSHADLCGADLRIASLRNANLNEADLRGAYLSHADLNGASLRDADLRGAYLSHADLNGASLRDADLRGTDLNGANLGDADLNGASLRDADLSYATFDDRIFCLDRIGSAKRRTTYNATKDIVWCGRFTGTFKGWVEQIRKTYPDESNVYRKEYEAAIAYFKAVAEASEKIKNERLSDS